MSEDRAILVDLSLGEATALVGIVQLHIKEHRERGEDGVADDLMNIRGRLIEATNATRSYR